MYRVLAFILVAFTLTPARSEPLPQPRVDFETSSKGPAGSTFVYRHHAGKMRVDMTLGGSQVAATSIADMAARKAVTMVGPANAGMAFEVDLNEAQLGLAAGTPDAKRLGVATVAGETCNLWEVAVPAANGPSKSALLPSAMVSCVTPDGIPLRTEIINNGARHVVIMEAMAVTRAAQDPNLFVVPPGTKIMKAPGPMKGLLGAFIPGSAPKP